MGDLKMVLAKDLFPDRRRTPVQPLRLVEFFLYQVNRSMHVEDIRIARVVGSKLRLCCRLELLCFQERCSVISAHNELRDRADVGLLRGRRSAYGGAYP